MNPIQNFTESSEIMKQLIVGVPDSSLDSPTPCDGWNVAELLEHIVDNCYFFAGAAGSTRTAADAPDGDVLARYSTASTVVLDAFGAGDVLTSDLATPFGTFPGSAVLAVAFADQLTHCWDLARSTGQEAAAPDALASDAIAAWEAFINADMRNGEMFGASQPTPEGASRLDALAAFTGRTF